VRVVLGMGQINYDIASNLYRHHSYIFFDLVVAREVRVNEPLSGIRASRCRQGSRA
jgi:hypothetical protein